MTESNELSKAVTSRIQIDNKCYYKSTKVLGQGKGAEQSKETDRSAIPRIHQPSPKPTSLLDFQVTRE